MPPLRLLSLDAFRGLTIAAMVLVNNPGTWAAVYAPLKHAEWHGLTPTDVIFPFFLLIVGMAIPLSQASVTAALLLLYWGALTLVPVPGYGRGDLGPEGNLAAWLDRTVLGPHIWRVACVYDPEGILSTLPAIATTLLGVLTGWWVQTERPPRTIAAGLALAGAIGTTLGAVWGVWFPVNKALWTSSYAVLTAGLALLVFAACYAAI